jgi:hypothetical protein
MIFSRNFVACAAEELFGTRRNLELLALIIFEC